MLSPMIPVLILLSWLRDVGASGELCDVTGRLPGEKVELDFPGRRLGACSDGDAAIPLLLSRSILYTAITRARELLIVVGDEGMIEYMVRNDKKQKRFSGLKWRLCHLN